MQYMDKRRLGNLKKSNEEQLQKITKKNRNLRNHLHSLKDQGVNVPADFERIVRQLLGAISKRVNHKAW